MKNKQPRIRFGLWLFAVLFLLTAGLLTACKKEEAAEPGTFDDFYKEYGVKLTGRVDGDLNGTYNDANDERITEYHVTSVDFSREEITVPEEFNGKPITGFQVETLGGGVVDSFSAKDCGSLKKLVLSKNISTIYSSDPGNREALTGWRVETFEVAEGNETYCSENGIVYNKEKTEIIWVPKDLKGAVTVPDTVTAIDYKGAGYCNGSMFTGCTGLTELVIPDSVQTLSHMALRGCSALKVLTVPFIPSDPNTNGGKDHVASVCFGDSKELESLTVSRGELTGIGAFASLKELILLDEVVFSGSLSSCKALETVRLPAGMTELGTAMFAGCTLLKSVELPTTVTTIGSDAFARCSSLTSIVIPEKVTVLKGGAFKGCTSLETIYYNAGELTLEEGLSGASIFSATGADTYGVTVVVGKAVEKIPAGLFREFGNGYTDYENGEARDSGEGKLVRVVFEEGSACTIIGKRAFSENDMLMSVTLGESVKTIEEAAFERCGALVEIVNRSSLELTVGLFEHGQIASSAVVIHEGDSMLTRLEEYWFLLGESDSYLLRYVGKGGALTLPTLEGGKSYRIFYGAMADNETLTAVTIPDCVSVIGDFAFNQCHSIQTLTIGKGVTEIGDNAFQCLHALETVYFNAVSCGDLDYDGCFNEGGNSEEYQSRKLIVGASVTRIPANLLKSGRHFDAVEFEQGSVCAAIGGDAFADTPFEDALEDRQESLIYVGKVLYRASRELSGAVTVPEGTLGIADQAFLLCDGITSVTLPDSLRVIGRGAFQSCRGLLTVRLPNSLTTLGSQAFSNCQKLTSIALPNSLVEIPFEAFQHCYELTSVTFPNFVTKIGDYAFYGCSELTSVVLPESLTELGSGALQNCAKLTTVHLPSELAELKGSTFANCSELTTISGGDGLTKVADSATEGCDKLTTGVYGNIIYRFFTPVAPVSTDIRIAYFKEGTTSIPARFFENCTALLHVYIPDTVETIGDAAFYNTNIGIRVLDGKDGRESGKWKLVSGTGSGLDSIYLGGVCYVGGQSTTYGSLTGGVVLDASGFAYLPSSHKLMGYFGSDTVLTLPTALGDVTITSIAANAFFYHPTLTKVTVPQGYETIGETAFAYCTSLEEVVLGGGTVLGIGAFMNCSVLETVDASHGTLTHIRPFAFGSCTALSEVKLSSTLLAINYNAFDGCVGLQAITIPASVEIMEYSAFSGCTALSSVTFEKTAWYVASQDGTQRLTVDCSDAEDAAVLLRDTYNAWYWFEKDYGDRNSIG